MGRSFDVNTPLRLFRQYTTRTPTPAAPETEKPPNSQKTSKKNSVRDFWKANIAKLPRRAKRPGKRKTRVVNGSRRASQLLTVPTNLDKEAYLRMYDGNDSSNEFTRSSKDAQTTRKDSTIASPGAGSPRLDLTVPARILSDDELQSYQSGAPHFSVDSVDQTPKISFVGPYSNDASEHLGQTNPWHFTFSEATVGAHEQSWDAGQHTTDSNSKNQISSASEVPCMASMAGLEPGTVGLKYFLQLPIADSNVSGDGRDTAAKRTVLATEPEKLGLRPLDIERLIDRLSELGDLEQQRKVTEDTTDLINEQKAAEMYADLFAKLLTPPKYGVVTEDDPTRLNVQIEALIKVLVEPGLWYDFGIVEWRIRIGSLLWTSEDDTAHNSEDISNERDTLLLQITLACELFLRISAMENSLPAPGVDTALRTYVRALLTPKIAWDLVLAERFLDNVRIAPKSVSNSKDQNRSSFMSMMSFVTAREKPDDSQIEPVLFPRHEGRQLEGLLTFAQAIEWPHTSDIKLKLEERTRQPPVLTWSAYATPVVTPALTAGNGDGYFGTNTRPQMTRKATAQSVQLQPSTAYEAENFGAGGWLSRSWLTGLVLPGEAASHFLISTVLENSPEALDSLGDSADLYGGFCYNGRSYWSKSCVIGRVLGAVSGARDCMGWISAPITGTLQDNGWISFEARPMSLPLARITSTEMVAKNSELFPLSATGWIREDDLTWVIDTPPILGNNVHYQGVSFGIPTSQYELFPKPNSPGEQIVSTPSTSTPSLTFASPLNGKTPNLKLSLTFDVYFISSYPCFPKKRTQAQHPVTDPSTPVEEKQLPVPPCHPLHKQYRYEVVPAASILTNGTGMYNLTTPVGEDATKVAGAGGDTLVLDCRGVADLQVLARAWCAKIGEHAIVGCSERSCLACCIREASGLGVRVVIRI